MDKSKQKESRENNTKFEKTIYNYPGMAVDVADKGKVDPKMVKQRTKTLNANPIESQQPGTLSIYCQWD